MKPIVTALMLLVIGLGLAACEGAPGADGPACPARSRSTRSSSATRSRSGSSRKAPYPTADGPGGGLTTADLWTAWTGIGQRGVVCLRREKKTASTPLCILATADKCNTRKRVTKGAMKSRCVLS